MQYMFQQHNIITAIEIGTSKICVLIGETSEDEKLRVIGFGEYPSNNSVIKGEIVDMDTALEQLTKAISDADTSSNRMINASNIIAISITGSSIISYQGSGAAFVHNEDHRIGEEEISTAVRTAQSNNSHFDRTLINSFDSYFMLDGHKRVRNPIDMIAHKLEVHIHAVYCKTNQIENFYSLLRDAGFDEDPAPVFSGIASAYGVLTEEEKESGALLLDMGAGTCEYLAIFNMGILSSGVLPVGFEHLANDLSLADDRDADESLSQIPFRLRAIQEARILAEVRDQTGLTRCGDLPRYPFPEVVLTPFLLLLRQTTGGLDQ